MKRTERGSLILGISVLLLAIFSIRLAIQFQDVVNVLSLISERLNLISKQVDAVRQCVQSIS